MARCGSTCFVESTLHRDWTPRRCVRAPREKQRPVILSPAAGRTLLGRGRRRSSRVGLATIDACGRRLQEGTPLPGRAIARAPLMIPLRPGNGGNERDGPRPQRPLARRRPSWGTPRHPRRSFPAPGRGRAGRARATPPRPKRRRQEAFRPALTHSGLHPPASGHPRRQAWATPRLEAGVQRRRMHAERGPHAPTTTRLSTQLTATAAPRRGATRPLVRRARCGASSRRSSAGRAPPAARPSATRGVPVPRGPGRPLRPAARRRAAVRSRRGTAAGHRLTATTPGHTATAPQARLLRPSPGWHTTHAGGGRGRTAGSPAPCRRRGEPWHALTRRPSTTAWVAVRPRPDRHGPRRPGSSAAGAAGWGGCRPGRAPGATTRPCTPA